MSGDKSSISRAETPEATEDFWKRHDDTGFDTDKPDVESQASLDTDPPSWHYDEHQQIGVDFTSQAEVEACDAKQGSNSPEACRDLLEDLGVGSGHTVLEFSTATGNVAIEAAKRCKHAYGIDV